MDRLLSYSIELTQCYTLYYIFLYVIHKQNQTYFVILPNNLQTFKKHLKEIYYALNCYYSSRSLECLNKHIKLLQRNVYDFRNFYKFKLLIFAQQKQVLHPNKKQRFFSSKLTIICDFSSPTLFDKELQISFLTKVVT
ncbi:TPA: transposase [Enterococcus faecalis]